MRFTDATLAAARPLGSPQLLNVYNFTLLHFSTPAHKTASYWNINWSMVMSKYILLVLAYLILANKAQDLTLTRRHTLKYCRTIWTLLISLLTATTPRNLEHLQSGRREIIFLVHRALSAERLMSFHSLVRIMISVLISELESVISNASVYNAHRLVSASTDTPQRSYLAIRDYKIQYKHANSCFYNYWKYKRSGCRIQYCQSRFYNFRAF